MKLPYGKSNFRRVIEENNYYVDKTQHIEYLENADSEYVFLLRPRRFGKSLFISMLEYYYDTQYKNDFQKLFGKLYIGKNPTPNANSYLILSLEFSRIDTSSKKSTEKGFLSNVIYGIRKFLSDYKQYFTEQDINKILNEASPADTIKTLFNTTYENKINIPICILIDEYDHFANEILAFNFGEFSEIVSKNGFVRKFYETIKTATQEGIVQRFFGTGVTPITLDSMTSGFNIAHNYSTRRVFNEAMGFTREEVINLLVDTAKYRGFEGFEAEKIMKDLKKWYDGYLFNEDALERIYNSDMVLYFTSEYAENRFKKYPSNIIDVNIASDYSKIQRLFSIQNRDENFNNLNTIIKEGEIATKLVAQYSFERDFTQDDFVSLLYYMGYLSIKKADMSELIMQIPNFVVKSLFYDYFAEQIRKDAALDVKIPDIRNIVKQLAQKNEVKPFIELVENTLKGLSNRDFIQFDEKYIKLLFVTFANAAGFYYVKSEPEINQTYPDVMFLWRPPYFPKYQFVFELKYLKKKDADKLEEVHEEAKIQLEGYMNNKEMQDFIVRSEGGMETVKAYTVVFVGEKAEVIEEFVS